MKHLIISFLLMVLGCSTYAQNRPMPVVDIKAKTSYKTTTTTTSTPVSVPQGQTFDLDVKHPKTEQDCLKNAFPTSNRATYKQQEYPVYVTKNNKLFIVAPNKERTGYYRKYIPQ